MPLRLVIRNGPSAGRIIEVQASPVVGRQGCDVDIDDPGMSRRHASLTTTAQGVYIADLGSFNGTFVNGIRIAASTWLRSGDVVLLGATEIAVEVNAGAPTVAYTPPPPRAMVPVAAPAAVPVVPVAPGAAGAYVVTTPRRSAAATRMPVATVLSFGVVVVTAIALILYFALR